MKGDENPLFSRVLGVCMKKWNKMQLTWLVEWGDDEEKSE